MKKESKETILSETGKFLIDTAKLVFGGVILAGIMKYENINPWLLFMVSLHDECKEVVVYADGTGPLLTAVALGLGEFSCLRLVVAFQKSCWV